MTFLENRNASAVSPRIRYISDSAFEYITVCIN